MLGAFETGRCAGLSHIVGVFDARMIRIYRRLGWGPIVLGTSGVGRHAISSGLWACDDVFRPRLLSGAGVSAEVSQAWYDRCRAGYRAAA
jgi:acyl homoserine lactone synthase